MNDTVMGDNRPQKVHPLDLESVVYNPHKDAEGNYADAWAYLRDIVRARATDWIKVTDADSPYSATPEVFHLIDTRNGQVEFTLEGTPDNNAWHQLVPAANTYSTNPLILRSNGNPIGGVVDDVTVDVDGLALDLFWIDDTYGWLVTERGNTVHLHRATISGSDVADRRSTNAENVVFTGDDNETLVVSTGDIDGNAQLPDTTAVSELFQTSLFQEGDGQKTFIADPNSNDEVISLDNVYTTTGRGSMIQAVKIGPGKWGIGGGLV